MRKKKKTWYKNARDIHCIEKLNRIPATVQQDQNYTKRYHTDTLSRWDQFNPNGFSSYQLTLETTP